MEFKQIQSLLHHLHHLPFHAIHSENELKLALNDSPNQQQIISEISAFQEYFSYLYDPLYFETSTTESFILFPDRSAFYLLGPFTSTQDSAFDKETGPLPFLATSHIPLMSELVYFLLFQKSGSQLLPLNDIQSHLPQTQVQTHSQPDSGLHEPTLENAMLQAIAKGDVSHVKSLLADNPLSRDNESIGLLSKKSMIRHYRNVCMTSVALATRAAIKGGLFSETAYRLSDYYIQAIEDSSFISELNFLMDSALEELTKKVRQELQLNLNPLTNRARDYIANHLYSPLTREDVASQLGVTPNHLDKVFKADLAKSVSTYLKEEKLSLAQQLIEEDALSLTDIAQQLGFTSLNTFSKQFKKMIGYPPSHHLNKKD